MLHDDVTEKVDTVAFLHMKRLKRQDYRIARLLHEQTQAYGMSPETLSFGACDGAVCRGRLKQPSTRCPCRRLCMARAAARVTVTQRRMINFL